MAKVVQRVWFPNHDECSVSSAVLQLHILGEAKVLAWNLGSKKANSSSNGIKLETRLRTTMILSYCLLWHASGSLRHGAQHTFFVSHLDPQLVIGNLLQNTRTT